MLLKLFSEIKSQIAVLMNNAGLAKRLGFVRILHREAKSRRLGNVEVLTTDRLSLRTWTEDDSASGFSIWGDAEVMKFVDSGEPNTLAEVKASIQAGIRHQQKYGHQHWAVIEIASGKLIGACGFNRTEHDGELELVFHFARAFWGKGFATEAAEGCLEYAKRILKPKKIVAGCHLDNEASKRVLLKVGFSFIGNRWFEDTQREEPCFELAI